MFGKDHYKNDLGKDIVPWLNIFVATHEQIKLIPSLTKLLSFYEYHLIFTDFWFGRCPTDELGVGGHFT